MIYITVAIVIAIISIIFMMNYAAKGGDPSMFAAFFVAVMSILAICSAVVIVQYCELVSAERKALDQMRDKE